MDKALQVFQEAGTEPPREQLRACGNKWLEKGCLDIAQQAFQAAGEELPRDKLLAYGDAMLRSRRPDLALEVLLAAGDQERLVELGEHLSGERPAV